MRLGAGDVRGGGDVALIRRREDAEGDRDAGVKVQVVDRWMREHFSNTFQRTERISQEGSRLLEVEGKGKKRFGGGSNVS